MKNFKKLFAIVFVVVTIVFGVLVMINDRDVFESLKLVAEQDELTRGIGILAIIVLVIDILLIALPVFGFVLVLTDKLDPYKAITDCALVVLAKFVLTIFAFMLLMMVWSAPAEVWNEYLFGKDCLAIIPLIVFVVAFALLMVAKVSSLQGTLTRAVLGTIGAALAVFGLVFYFILGGGESMILGTMGSDPDFLTIFGLVVGIACFGGLVAYSYLPQTREFGESKAE